MKHRNIGTKLQFLYLVKVKIVSVHAVMLQRSVMQVLDEICSSSNNRGVYRNEREIKFGYKKKHDLFMRTYCFRSIQSICFIQ